jgi:hypothetical protein
VSPRDRTGPNPLEDPGPSGLVSRLKAEVALSADGRRAGWSRRSRGCLRLTRVGRSPIAPAQDAALPERWLSAAGTPSHDLARDISATHGRIRQTMMPSRPWSAPPSTTAGFAMPVDSGAPRTTSLPSATPTSTRLGGSGSDGVLVVEPTEHRPAAHRLRRHGPHRRQPARPARRLPAKPAMRPPMVVA